jgi:hypothetical protein
MQEADRNRFDPGGAQLAGDGLDLPLVHRPDHLTRGIEALVHLERHFAPGQRLRSMEEQIERFDAVAAADRIDVPEAPGRQQSRLRALAFEHRVDGDRRTVQHFGEPARVAVGEAQAFGDAGGRICGHCRGLRGHHLAVDDPDQVREGSADVDADNIHRDWSVSSPARRCASRSAGVRRYGRTR